MGFARIDDQILTSSIWLDRDARDILLTAILLARQCELDEPAAQIATRSLDLVGWEIPPGTYGMVRAATTGLCHMAGVPIADGLSALERLASPEHESRSSAFDGRRLVRVDGGFILLNYDKFKTIDYTNADRQRRHRDKKKGDERSNGVTASTPVTVTDSNGSNAVTKRPVTRSGIRDQGSDLFKVRESPGPPSGLAGSDLPTRSQKKGVAAARQIFDPDTAKGFSAFWQIFPNKICKADAIRVWFDHRGGLGNPAQGNIEANGELVRTILRAISRQAPGIRAMAERSDPARLHASTWISKSRWNDVVESGAEQQVDPGIAAIVAANNAKMGLGGGGR